MVTSDPPGRFMFAGGVLADVAAKDHVPLEFCSRDPRLEEAFRVAGQGKIPEACLAEIGTHAAVVYLHFPLDVVGQRVTAHS